MWCIAMFWKLFSVQRIPFLLLSLLPTVTLQTSKGVIEAGAPSKSAIKSAKITKVITNFTLYERGDIIQFIISWEDNLPKDTSYNIIVTTMNRTGCGEPPCSAYGVIGKSKQIIIPENPMAHVDQNECGFMFGCNYSVKVETSNASVSRYGMVCVPYCVMGLCSCQHAEDLPQVISSSSIPNNETILFNWSIKYLKRPELIKHPVNITNNKWKLYLIISEQSNPLLSWGGKLIPITEYLHPLKNVSDINIKGTMQGTFKIRIPKQLVSKTVLKLRSYIIDDLNCGGPEQFTKITVPDFFSIQEKKEITKFNWVIVLIVLSVLFLCLIPLVMIYCCWKRHQRTKVLDSILEHETKHLSQFSGIFEMEDNINYVDKYIEEAQAKGLADFYEIPHSKIQIGPEIGEGAFGRVYKAVAENIQQRRGNTVVAVKQLKNNLTADEVAEFLSEIEMLKKVGMHKNIVSFLGCCTIRAPYLMIMEFVGRGDLLTYLRTVRLEVSNAKLNGQNNSSISKEAQTKGKLKYIELQVSSQSIESSSDIDHQPKSSVAETTYTIIDNEDLNDPFEYVLDHKELYDFALQIVKGMRFLEEQQITHRDLAARNILIDNNKTLKISDFGLSRHGIYTNTKTRKLPLRWLSIEAIRDNIYSNKSDVWAYGVVLWEIGTLGASPYPTISNHELIPFLLSGKRLEKPDICTNQLYSIMLQCWDENVLERPNFVDLFEILSPSAAYVDINSLSSDYVFPPIK